MGESQKKKKSLDLTVNNSNNNKKKKADNNTKFRRNTITVIVVIAVILALSFGIKTNVLYNSFAAVKIGNHSYTAADYNFQFYNVFYQTYSNIQSYYGEAASSMLDPKKPLDQQKYTESQTWADYFKETSLNNLQQLSILVDAASKAGYKLPDEGKKTVDSTIDGYKQSYKSNGYATFAAFLENNFGKGMTENILRKNLENQTLAGYYFKELNNSKNYSNKELDEYYNQNKEKFDSITYRSYFVSGAADEKNGIDSTKAMENAKAAAEKIAAARSETEFSNLVYQTAPEAEKETYKDAAATLNRYQKSASFTKYTKDWLIDPSRKQGETKIVNAENGYYALYFLSRSDNSYNVKKVRHILISVDDFKDAAKSQEAMKKAQDILNQWKEGEKTEASFTELAKQKSSDNGSEGGFYEAYRGQMVLPFEEWCFDTSRKAGDTGIVKTDYGYHIMYFIGDGDLYRYVLARDDKKTTEYNTWFENQKKLFEIKQTAFMRYTRHS